MYSLHAYSSMFADEARMTTYTKALESVITPESVVLDLGAGSGLFSLIACKLGAHKVYAIEPSDCIQIGRELARANNCSERIEWIQEDSRKVRLKEKVDVILSDIRGMLPFIEENFAIITDARTRFLKDDGCLLPHKDTLCMALVENKEIFEECVQPWKSRDGGLDLSPLRKRHAHQWRSCSPKQEHLVSAQKQWAILDYLNLHEPNIDNTVTLCCDRNTTVHGFYLWFDAEIAPGIGFSGGPGENRPSVYGCGFFPWPKPIQMKAGQQAQIRLQASLVAKKYLWRWRTTIIDTDTQNVTSSYDQSTFHAEITSLPQLRKRAHSYTPQLSQNGQLNSAALQLMDGAHNLETIAHDLMARFPAQFSDYEESLAFVGDVSAKFSHCPQLSP